MAQTGLRASRFAWASEVSGSPPAYRIAHLLTSAILHLLFNIEISGRANVPPDRPYIAIANHLNWLDSFALLIALPRHQHVHVLAWSKVMESSKLAWLIEATKVGFISAERDPVRRSRERRKLHRELLECLAGGNPLVIFPEGQIGCTEGGVAALMPGFARLSLSSGAPVLPVGLSGSRELWLRKRIHINIGSPISPERVTAPALVDRSREAVCELIPEYRDPGGVKLFRRRLTRLIPSLTNWYESDL